MSEVSENSDLRRFRPTGMERSLSDFFDTGKKEQFWCPTCKVYSEIELEVQSGRDMLVMFTCGHKDLKGNARRLTRSHKEEKRK